MLTNLVLAAACASPSAGMPSLVPMPSSLAWKSGGFSLDGPVRLVGEEAGRLRPRYEEALGRRLDSRPAGRSISLKKAPGLPPEAYRLRVSRKEIQVEASGYAGFFYAAQTLRQLRKGGSVSSCEIGDQPRFAWRGLMLDESRHFFGASYVRRFIDQMAAYKLNTFHWHLTDDGGWRVQIDRYPKLASVGAFRKDRPETWSYQNLYFPGQDSGVKLYGGFYSKVQLKDMVRYAAERNVTIVPEIEMPGHSIAAGSSYPALQCSLPEGAMRAYLKGANTQAPAMVCPGKDSTLDFYRNVLSEVIQIFPSKFIHIGADEVDKTLWRQCRDCQARIKSLGLKDEHELQSWFVQQMERFLASKGRRLIGWDEILEGGLAPGATVMSWRGIQGGISAAKAGHDVVMSPTSHCYFDYSYSNISTEKVYGFDPIPQELKGAERSHVLGGQGNLWTEWMPGPSNVDGMAYPRALALAEALWTSPEKKSWAGFQARLDGQCALMAQMGIQFRLEPPVLIPTVLNRAAARGWTVSGARIPGATVYVNGRPFKGDVVPSGVREAQVQLRLPGGRMSGFASGRVVSLRHAAFTRGSGLLVSRIPWKGSECPKVSAFASAPAVRAPRPSLDKTALTEPAALRFTGGLVVPKDGRYTLILGSDDGSVLLLDGQPVVVNDGLHAYEEAVVTVDLKKGAYPLDLIYFDGGGASSLAFDWIVPGGSRTPVSSFAY